MNNLSKSFKDEDGREETILASSDDNYDLKLGNYTLVNRTRPEGSKLARKFRSSMFGADIGIRSKGFSSMAILATVLVLATLVVLYFLWRF